MPPTDAAAHRITLTAAGRTVHVLPPGVTRVELVSGHFTPQGDGRKLGARVTSLALDGGPVALDRQILASGFHPLEEAGHTLSRWTDGCGVLIIPASTEERVLEVGVEYVVRPL